MRKLGLVSKEWKEQKTHQVCAIRGHFRTSIVRGMAGSSSSFPHRHLQLQTSVFSLWPQKDQLPGISLLKLDPRDDYRIELLQAVLIIKMQSPNEKKRVDKPRSQPCLSTVHTWGGGGNAKPLRGCNLHAGTCLVPGL